MAINPISILNSIASPQTKNATSSSNAAATTTGGSERDMFMSLLVAQLKNQDPLSPQDGTAFVAQLAQFNSLDQLVGIRDSIDKLTQLLQDQQNHQTLATTPSVKN